MKVQCAWSPAFPSTAFPSFPDGETIYPSKAPGDIASRRVDLLREWQKMEKV